MRVACLGVHILDILGAPIEGPAGYAHRYLLDDVRLTAAGTAGGTAVDLVKLGVEVEAMGVIGDDDIGDLLLARFDQQGVGTGHLVRRRGGTSTTLLPIRADGSRFAVFHRPGVTRRLTADDVDLDAVMRCDLLHIGGPDVLDDFNGEPLVATMRAAQEQGITTTMDVLSACNPAMLEQLSPALPFTSYAFPNHEQLTMMTGLTDLYAGAGVLLDRGVGCVVVTCGADGVLVRSPEESFRLAAFDVPLVDTTGCGDAFSAGFIVGILERWPLAERALFGSACAALVAQGLGSDAGIVDREQTRAFLDAQRAVLGPPQDPSLADPKRSDGDGVLYD